MKFDTQIHEKKALIDLKVSYAIKSDFDNTDLFLF